MADISLYLTNVNVSIGQTMELQQVCEQLPLRRDTFTRVYCVWWSHGGVTVVSPVACCHLSAVFVCYHTRKRCFSLSEAVITRPVCRPERGEGL